MDDRASGPWEKSDEATMGGHGVTATRHEARLMDTARRALAGGHIGAGSAAQLERGAWERRTSGAVDEVSRADDCSRCWLCRCVLSLCQQALPFAGRRPRANSPFAVHDEWQTADLARRPHLRRHVSHSMPPSRHATYLSSLPEGLSPTLPSRLQTRERSSLSLSAVQDGRE